MRGMEKGKFEAKRLEIGFANGEEIGTKVDGWVKQRK